MPNHRVVQEELLDVDTARAEYRRHLAEAGIELASGGGGNPLRAVTPRPRLVALLMRWFA